MRSTFPAGWLLSTARRHRRLAIVSLALGLLAALACGVALARPWSAHIEVGGLLDGPFLRGFHAHEHDGEVNFRWSDVSSAVVLPGAGVAAVQLRVHSQADGKQLTIDDGGGATTLRLRPGWQTLWLAPRASQGSGDVRVAIATTPATSGADPRQLGVVLDWIDLGGQSAPAGQAALLGTIVALVVALAGWALGRAWAGVVAGAALGIGGLAALTWDGGAYRLLLTSYTGRLALTLALALALGAAVERGLARIAREPADGGGAWRHRLAAVVALVFLARLAGMAYPLAFISDIRFHLYRSELIRDGRLLELLLPNSSLTPMQWQSDITIPYSPLYYMLLAPAMWLPGSGPALAMMAFSSLVDALAALLAAALVILGGGGRRAALAAATLMGFLPFGLLVSVSWGLFPTLLGQCLALLAIVTWLWARPRLSRRRELWLVAAAMTLAYISYPTALLFLGVAWLALLALLALQRDASLRPTLLAGLIAAGASLALYYGWHIPALVSRTFPAVLGALAGEGDLHGGGRSLPPIGQIMWAPLWGQYGPLALGMAGGGALLLAGRLWRGRHALAPDCDDARRRMLATVLLAWCAAYPPFALADAYVPLVAKHVLHLLPAIAVLGGLLLEDLGRRRSGIALAGAAVALICWQGLALEVHQIIYAYVQLR